MKQGIKNTNERNTGIEIISGFITDIDVATQTITILEATGGLRSVVIPKSTKMDELVGEGDHEWHMMRGIRAQIFATIHQTLSGPKHIALYEGESPRV